VARDAHDRLKAVTGLYLYHFWKELVATSVWSQISAEFDNPRIVIDRISQLHDDLIRYLIFLRDKSQKEDVSDALLRAWYCFPEGQHLVEPFEDAAPSQAYRAI
jgi:hypothetical protein